MKKIFCYLIFAALLAVFAGGCTVREVEPDPSEFANMPKRTTKKTLQKIPTVDCELKIPRYITVQAGTSLNLNTQLIYHGRRPLEIKEWYMFDQYNFEVRYRRIPSDNAGNKKTPFKIYRVRPPQGADVNRSGLILNPANRAVLTVNMPFTGELNPGEKAQFEVYIYTTLRTFKLRSNRMVVRTQ